MAIDNPSSSEQILASGSVGPAVLDEQHVGDIVGALGPLKRSGTGKTRSWRRKFSLLLVIIGPGLIVTGGGNDAGGVQVYAQMGQDYGMRLLWSLALLFPILFFCQEMVVLASLGQPERYAQCLAKIRYVTASDRHDLVGARLGDEEQGSLEALLNFPYPAEVDQKPAVDAKESLAF